MNAKELVEFLDEAGLVITDEELIDEELSTLPINPDHHIDMLGELIDAVESLFENCAMIHNSWGDGDNTKQADAAIKATREALAKAKGE